MILLGSHLYKKLRCENHTFHAGVQFEVDLHEVY